MNWRNKLIITLLLLLAGTTRAQIGNLIHLDEKTVHFGIQVGYTQSKFDLRYSDDPELRERLQGTRSYYNAGFHLAQINDLRLTNHLNLRLCPGITLVTRSLNFDWEPEYYGSRLGLDKKRNVESVYADIPLDLKLRADRWRNFRPYVTGGVSYGFDFASLRKNKNNNDESIIRLNPHDFRYTACVGFDFYLRYVKFAIELRMSFGLTDLKVVDDDIYTRSFDNLNSRTFMLGFTFEG